MNLITTLDQHDMGLHEATDTDISRTRHAARAVMTNDSGKIAIMHFTKTGAYKLPGGGVDEGEEIIAALYREILEETGYTITNIRELGVVEEDRYFCGLHQTSHCYEATAVDFVGAQLTTNEAEGGMNLRWADSIDQAIAWIESCQTTDTNASTAGLVMMQTRDIAILRAAKKIV